MHTFPFVRHPGESRDLFWANLQQFGSVEIPAFAGMTQFSKLLFSKGFARHLGNARIA
jgi:hypothetical protein